MKLNKIKAGVVFGTIAGIIDIIPMLFQKLSWDACLSAFSLWSISGFLIATNDLKLNGILKGVLISFLVLTPTAIIIASAEPLSLIPICIMTIILGSFLGYFIDKYGNIV